MTTGKVTNILLLLIFLALVANLFAPVFRPKEAVAITPNPDSIPPAVIAAQVAEGLAPDRLAAMISAALKDIAVADQQIASAIREHSRSNENVAYALEKIGGEMRSQRSQ